MSEKKLTNLDELQDLLLRLQDVIDETTEADSEDKEWMTDEQKEQKHLAEWDDFEWEQRKKAMEREGPVRIWLTGSVREEMNESVIKKIREAADYPERDIELYVSTYGGSVYEAIGICDAILAAPNHVKTIGSGKIMSAGGPILVCGNERVMTESSFLMIHDIWSITAGSPTHMESDIRHVRDLAKVMNNYFVKFSDLEANFLKEMCEKKSDSYFTAKQALKMGVIDAIEKHNLPSD